MFGLFESKKTQADKLHTKAMEAFKCRDYIRSFDYYSQLVQLDDSDPVVWYEMSVLIGQYGHDWNKAKCCIEKALSIDSENFPQAWKGLAIIEKHLGNTDRAVSLFKMLRTKYGWHPEKDPTVKPDILKWLSEHNCL